MTKFELYLELKKKGFPQGGSGSYLKDPKTEEMVYIPKFEEIFTQFIGDPIDHEVLVDTLAKVWIERSKK